MDNGEMKKDKKEAAKENLGRFWQKTQDFGKKAAEGAKNLAEQTKKNIHEQQAKRYTAVTAKDYKAKDFKLPGVIVIKDDSANREFVEDPEAIGWIEIHKDVPVLYMYFDFVKKCGLSFVPVAQKEIVYCVDVFDLKRYVNTAQVFARATEEKLAELRNIAYCLGAKMCSVQIVEADKTSDSFSVDVGLKSKGGGNKKSEQKKGRGNSGVEASDMNVNKQSGKSVTRFKGSDTPQKPELKWFLHDDNIKGLIEMRCNFAIESSVLELRGSSSATMSRAVACAIDDIAKIGGSLSMEKQSVTEHSNILLYEVEF